MEESMDSHFEQGSTHKPAASQKSSHNEMNSSKFVSQSEEDSSYPQSEMSQSVSDKKSTNQGRKRNVKAQGKNKNSESKETEDDQSQNSKPGKSSSKRKKKTEQYKNQVIVDQYGVFEYDKDPEGYKKARKRQQNRESALRARDKRVHKMESVETRLEKIEQKSHSLEKENLVLKAEKQQLQDQVKNLLSIITSFGQTKRFKTTENEEPIDLKSSDHVISTDTPNELKEPISEPNLESLNGNEGLSMSPKAESPEKTVYRLMRNGESSMFDQEEEGGYGDLFQKGLMLSLTIVMCMVLCLTGFSITESLYSTQKLCTTCQASKNPFDLRSTESKNLMSHPMEPHYIEGGFSQMSTLLLNIWIGVFVIMVFLTFLFKRQQYLFYNMIASPLKRRPEGQHA